MEKSEEVALVPRIPWKRPSTDVFPSDRRVSITFSTVLTPSAYRFGLQSPGLREVAFIALRVTGMSGWSFLWIIYIIFCEKERRLLPITFMCSTMVASLGGLAGVILGWMEIFHVHFPSSFTSLYLNQVRLTLIFESV
jgi:hypothetical protein